MSVRPRGHGHIAWWAFYVHRLSGLALALFIPFHFWALGTAIGGEAALDDFLRWSDRPVFKVAEWGLVVLLALHLTGGMRLLALELLPWRDWQKSLAAVAAGISLVVAAVFLLDVR